MIDQLGVDPSLAFPDSKGFSRRNLHYMRGLDVGVAGPGICATGCCPLGLVNNSK